MATSHWIGNIQDWLLPRLCPGCGLSVTGPDPLCGRCRASLPRWVHGCLRCAVPLPRTSRECGHCQRIPPAYTSAIALYEYGPPIDYFIQKLKFHHDLSVACWLGEELAAAVSGSGFRPDALVPVPLHRRRLCERGFNQSVEIARPMARRLRLPMIVDGISRLRDTPKQSGLGRPDRQKNLRNAFTASSDLTNRRFAIIDDVMTTGATVQHLALALKRAGAATIAVWVVARAR